MSILTIGQLLIGTPIFLIGIYVMLHSFEVYKHYQIIRDTPTSKIQSAAIGPIEIKGEIINPDSQEKIYKHPFNSEECVYYQRKIEGYNPNNGWSVVKKDSTGEEFYIKDGTGKILVKPEDPTLNIQVDQKQSKEFNIESLDKIPSELEGIDIKSDRIGFSPFRGPTLFKKRPDKYKVTIKSLKQGMDTYALGYARQNKEESRSEENEENLVLGSADKSNQPKSRIQKLPFIGISKPFIISNKKEETLISNRKLGAPFVFIFGLVFSTGGLLFVLMGLL